MLGLGKAMGDNRRGDERRKRQGQYGVDGELHVFLPPA
jgi:hypothetical protein